MRCSQQHSLFPTSHYVTSQSILAHCSRVLSTLQCGMNLYACTYEMHACTTGVASDSHIHRWPCLCLSAMTSLLIQCCCVCDHPNHAIYLYLCFVLYLVKLPAIVQKAHAVRNLANRAHCISCRQTLSCKVCCHGPCLGCSNYTANLTTQLAVGQVTTLRVMWSANPASTSEALSVSAGARLKAGPCLISAGQQSLLPVLPLTLLLSVGYMATVVVMSQRRACMKWVNSCMALIVA